MKKRVLSLLLVLVMAVGMLPVSVMAEEAPAPEPVFQKDLDGTEVTYYSDSTISSLSIRIQKDETSYNKDTLEIEWQSSDSGEDGSFSTVQEGVFNPLGNGLQRKLLEAALPLVRPGIVGIGATVSPENQYSLNNALACGFVIADRREMYGGYDRYLLKKML